MAVRTKRSISLPPDLDAAIERAALAGNTSVSAWIAEVARHRLRIEAGQRGITEWEQENGPLTAAERGEGRARARQVLGRAEAKRRRAS